ncbi:MAG TPA: DUF4129 domain-containing protein [Kofleriaceae bacterium]|nr:DUF4129 domain-containing protein [Kofleriaceae bacterium]
MSARLAAWVVAVAVSMEIGGAGDAVAQPTDDDARIEKATREVLDRRYQRELPIGKLEVGPGERPKDGRPKMAPGRTRRAPDRARDPEEMTVGSGISAVMRVIVYGVLIVAFVMILMWVARDLRRGSDQEQLEGEELPQATIDQDVIERPIGDADELARAGRYAEAIHTLLLRTLVELVRATRTRVPASLTSREILARVPLVPEARAALYQLVSTVEVTYFGDEVPGAADYDRCRHDFQAFAQAYRNAGAAPAGARKQS